MDWTTTDRRIGPGICILAAILLLTVMAFPITPVLGDDSVTVSCYSDAGYLDDVDDVTDVTRAAQICNSLYSGCEGRCTACYHDFDYDETVCIDSRGRQFLR